MMDTKERSLWDTLNALGFMPEDHTKQSKKSEDIPYSLDTYKQDTSKTVPFLNELADVIMDINQEKGFNDAPVHTAEAIALMHSELSEALEADRKDLMDDKLPHRTGVEVEMADALIRILHFAARKKMDIHGAVMEKLAYNRTRPYKHGKKY